MTLIIGRVRHGKTYLLGETELTFYNQRNANPYVEGCLKQYMINDHLAIGFSGVREHFEQVLLELLSCKNGSEVIQIALAAAAKGLKFDLLVGEIGKDKLQVVKDGIFSESQVGYVGDTEAFNGFQRAYHRASSRHGFEVEPNRAQFRMLRLPEPVMEDEIYHNLYQSLKEVILDTRIKGVGGAIIPLCSDNGKFRFLNYGDVTSDQLNIEDFRDKPRPIEFGTASGGGYAFDLCDDTPFGGKGANIGFYILQGEFGVIFPSDRNGFRCAELVKAKNPAYWVLETNKRLGHGIGCGFLTEDHCGAAGEELLKAQKDEDALFCYELKKDSLTLRERPGVFDRYIAGYATALFNCSKRQEAIAVLRTFISQHSHSRLCIDALSKMLRVYDPQGST